MVSSGNPHTVDDATKLAGRTSEIRCGYLFLLVRDDPECGRNGEDVPPLGRCLAAFIHQDREYPVADPQKLVWPRLLPLGVNHHHLAHT